MGADLKPLEQQALHLRHQGFRVQVRGELQLVEEREVVAGELLRQAEEAAVVGFGQEVKETVVLGAGSAKLFEVCFRITPLQPDQGRARGLLLRHQGVFQAEPEQGLVLPRLFLMLEAAEKGA